MYDTILVPTDGSDAAERAIDEAVGIAENVGATVHALYVVDTSSFQGDLVTDPLLEQLERGGEEAVTAVEKRAGAAGVPIESTVTGGQAHRAILDNAAEIDADLIVMGTHGRSGLNRYLLGSVTEKVVRTADVPVLTVRTAEE